MSLRFLRESHSRNRRPADSFHGDSRYLEPILQAALDGLRPPTDPESA
jgi:hypothetical protein